MLGYFITGGYLKDKTLRIAQISDELIEGKIYIYLQGELKGDAPESFKNIYDGKDISIMDIFRRITKEGKKKAVFLGGEPILQSANLGLLCEKLNRKEIETEIVTYFDKEELTRASKFNRFISRLMSNAKVRYRKNNPNKSIDEFLVKSQKDIIPFNKKETYIKSEGSKVFNTIT